MIKFISYDGAYPNLCSGTLVVEIDGKRVSFGKQFLWDWEKKAGVKPADYGQFWCSGGSVSFDDDWTECVLQGSWELVFDEKAFPEEIVKLMPDLIKVFNENVPEGCCGGCV